MTVIGPLARDGGWPALMILDDPIGIFFVHRTGNRKLYSVLKEGGWRSGHQEDKLFLCWSSTILDHYHNI